MKYRSHLHREVKIVAEIIVNFDIGERIPKVLDVAEISGEIASAVCGCSQFENCSSTRVEKITTNQPV